jgi:hypothetical protein
MGERQDAVRRDVMPGRVEPRMARMGADKSECGELNLRGGKLPE